MRIIKIMGFFIFSEMLLQASDASNVDASISKSGRVSPNGFFAACTVGKYLLEYEQKAKELEGRLNRRVQAIPLVAELEKEVTDKSGELGERRPIAFGLDTYDHQDLDDFKSLCRKVSSLSRSVNALREDDPTSTELVKVGSIFEHLRRMQKKFNLVIPEDEKSPMFLFDLDSDNGGKVLHENGVVRELEKLLEERVSMSESQLDGSMSLKNSRNLNKGSLRLTIPDALNFKTRGSQSVSFENDAREIGDMVSRLLVDAEYVSSGESSDGEFNDL
ncbi:hypothetical protein HYV10_00795 [Candidatus Dependentiae bacterium]|nr:hypothetical protein [Candidatus Dependentiae bacterium]